jgi:predicted nucleic acid-binding protein
MPLALASQRGARWWSANLHVLIDEERHARLTEESKRTGRSVGDIVLGGDARRPGSGHRGDARDVSARLVFLDTSVVLTALGEHPNTPACRALLQRAASGHLFVHTAAECLHEVVFHRMRVGPRAPAVAHLRAIRDLCVVHPMDDLVLDRATDLLATTQARGRDAFIAATALPAGFDTVVTTTDDRFVEVPGLRPVHPAT